MKTVSSLVPAMLSSSPSFIHTLVRVEAREGSTDTWVEGLPRVTQGW